MALLAKTFLLLAVILGVAGRSVTHASHSHSGDHANCHSVCHLCCDGEHQDSHSPEPEDPERPAPLHDSHVHSCCVPMPFMAPADALAPLRVPVASLAELIPVHLLPPDDPVFALDKPPLI